MKSVIERQGAIWQRATETDLPEDPVKMKDLGNVCIPRTQGLSIKMSNSMFWLTRLQIRYGEARASVSVQISLIQQ